ncbi:hypothetical protein [Kitasatospora sp. A2-31]|uniref:hypothetical protein n=1 Tax=Kitasatospora sp. A2-31 TaxID=2916414 RepID=UPI001EEE2356|nr:hypothetical protein [Kitasatospora sp. A2-31]MCG6499421.1 hypothetical protein [Kitasatospora sp. A2-31]
MLKPTDILTVSDITEVTGVADVVIAGTPLWVSPGQTPAGRYWTLWTPMHLLAGMVVELKDGTFNAETLAGATHTETAQDAALVIAAAVHAPTPKGADK